MKVWNGTVSYDYEQNRTNSSGDSDTGYPKLGSSNTEIDVD